MDTVHSDKDIGIIYDSKVELTDGVEIPLAALRGAEFKHETVWTGIACLGFIAMMVGYFKDSIGLMLIAIVMTLIVLSLCPVATIILYDNNGNIVYERSFKGFSEINGRKFSQKLNLQITKIKALNQ